MAASVLMVSYGKTASKYPLQVHGPSQQRLGAPGHWAPWSAWSPCSRTCGGGVAVQTRDCRPMETRRRRRLTEPPPRSHCVGVYKRVHVCNDQECPPGSKDFRSAQCEAFNGKPFMGRLYLWEPFLQAPNPCELNCRAAGFRFYATLNKTVVDGTPCRGEAPPPARHVCVAGVCQKVSTAMAQSLRAPFVKSDIRGAFRKFGFSSSVGINISSPSAYSDDDDDDDDNDSS
ncbi:thrombospondin type-1 domain-containing protein 4-like [Schistocerca nitens]|uniref:thrombospondin type-1 domain-containing protein 4-like n=1 Tax=Schistocerca nitens TaxID=7011 RepID=UPI0021196A53|nr:thrombospondin type-1 domain-containing protein 4-like [Schistocerca nitens]